MTVNVAATDGDTFTVSAQAWRVAGICSAGTFVFVMDSGLLSISFPSLSADFDGADRATLSWAATGFAVVMAGCMAFAGSVADRLGRKRVYLGGLVLYGVAGLCAALLPGLGVFLTARLVQGAGAAFFVTAGLALALVAFPVPRRATALGLWGVVGSAAAVIAPTVGAAVLDTWSWRWAFGGLAVIALVSALVGATLPADHQDTVRQGPPDPIAVVCGAGGVALIVLAISRSRIWGWIDARTLGCLAVGALLVMVVGLRSHHHPRPLVPAALGRNRVYLTITLAAVVQQVGFFAYFFSMPLILTGVWGWSTLEAGYAMAFSMLVSALPVMYCARWVERHGYLGLILVGAAFAGATSVWWLATFGLEPELWALVPGLLLIGVGGSIVGNFISGAAFEQVPAAIMGQGNSLHQMSRRVGGAIGVALAIALLGESRDPQELLDGARRVWVLLLVVHALMVLAFVLGQPRARHADAPVPSSA